MTSVPVNLAVEDALSEAVLRRVLTDANKEYAIGTSYSRGGFGYLKKIIGGLNRAAVATPFLVLTDLDQADCPIAIIRDWLPEPRNPNLIFRVAVREVESWLLAGRAAFADFFGVQERLIPQNPESLADPKKSLIELIRHSRNGQIRSDVVPRHHSTSTVGPNYNGRLIMFVKYSWDPRLAMQGSNSLARLVNILDNFTPSWAEDQ